MKATELITTLKSQDLVFLTGVPCSYLEGLLECFTASPNTLQNVIATSEGEAVGIAAGYHLSTGKVPVIYMQNSGLGNAVNPLTSLMDEEVYSIPAVIFLSWRGEPGQKDEPQHKKMGHIMLDLLRDLDIPYEFASADIAETAKTISSLKTAALTHQKPVVLIFRPKIIEVSGDVSQSAQTDYMRREEILSQILPKIGESPIVTTTGKTSREVYELRERAGQSHRFDFLTVGSMGCAAGIGLGIAMQTNKKVFIIDGDGAVLMKMGTLATIGYYQPRNLVHIVIDNGAYESTGGQPTVSKTLNWHGIFMSAGYQNVTVIKTAAELAALDFDSDDGPRAIVIYAVTGSRPDLGRPTTTPIENKTEFMSFLESA